MITLLNLDKLKSEDPKIKYGFAKELLKIAEENPEQLYPYFNEWITYMHGDNKILRWTAIDIIGHLSAVDKDGKVEAKMDELIEFLHGGHLITCNHAIFALGQFAKHHKAYKERILKELLNISSDNFNTEECRNVATGKVIDIMNEFVEDIKQDPKAIQFVQNARKNPRNATRKKANALIKKLDL